MMKAGKEGGVRVAGASIPEAGCFRRREWFEGTAGRLRRDGRGQRVGTAVGHRFCPTEFLQNEVSSSWRPPAQPFLGPMDSVKLFLQKTLSVTGAVDFLLLRRVGKVMPRGRRPSAPAYVHFDGPKMDATSEATHEEGPGWQKMT